MSKKNDNRIHDPEIARSLVMEQIDESLNLPYDAWVAIRATLLGRQAVYNRNELERIRNEKVAAAKASARASGGVHNAGCTSNQSGQQLPEIHFGDRQLRDVINDTWQAVLAANQPEPKIYRGCGTLVIINRDGKTPKVRVLSTEELFADLLHIANWISICKGTDRQGQPPKDVVKTLLVRPIVALPPLNRIITSPRFSSSGLLIDKPGYYIDEALFYDEGNSLSMDPIPDNPTDAEVQEAVYLLEDILADFPFVGPSDKAHAYSFLFSLFDRALIDGFEPLHFFGAPDPGTGKGLLVDLLCMIAFGYYADSSTFPPDEGEMRKFLIAKLCEAPEIVFFDNTDDEKEKQKNSRDSSGKIHSPTLASILTKREHTDRLLAVSRVVTVSNDAVWAGTGNNVRLSKELARRTLMCRLDPKNDQPWLRDTSKFKHPDIRQFVKDNRARLVRAVLVITQSWLAKGRPSGSTRLGTFEAHSDVIGGILKNAGIKGFLEDLAGFYEIADVDGQMWRDFTEKWWEKFCDNDVTVKELNIMCDPLQLMMPVRGDGNLKSQLSRLGRELKKHIGRVHGKFSLIISKDDEKKGRHYKLNNSETPKDQNGGGLNAPFSPCPPVCPLDENQIINSGYDEEGDMGDFFSNYTDEGIY